MMILGINRKVQKDLRQNSLALEDESLKDMRGKGFAIARDILDSS